MRWPLPGAEAEGGNGEIGPMVGVVRKGSGVLGEDDSCWAGELVDTVEYISALLRADARREYLLFFES